MSVFMGGETAVKEKEEKESGAEGYFKHQWNGR